MKTIPANEQKERRIPIEILELDPPFEDDFLPANFPFMTGEPGLGRNNDIVGAKSSRYVASLFPPVLDLASTLIDTST
jgi:hypothetical protein